MSEARAKIYYHLPQYNDGKGKCSGMIFADTIEEARTLERKLRAASPDYEHHYMITVAK